MLSPTRSNLPLAICLFATLAAPATWAQADAGTVIDAPPATDAGTPPAGSEMPGAMNETPAATNEAPAATTSEAPAAEAPAASAAEAPAETATGEVTAPAAETTEAPVAAPEPEPSNEAPASSDQIEYLYALDQDIAQFAEVSIASKNPELSIEAPASVTVFTRQEILNMGITTVEDLLQYVAGYQVTREVEQGATWRIAARGRSTSLSQSVLFLLNGQRMNDLYTGGAILNNRLISVENIKQVEIIRGPGSALYGSNAFLGVVNITTLTDSNDVLAEVGTLDTVHAAANFSHEAGDFHFSGSINAFRDSGFEFKQVQDSLGRVLDTRDPASGVDLDAAIRFKDFTLQLRHTERQLEEFMPYFVIADDLGYEKVNQSSATLSWDRDLTTTVNVHLSAGYTHFGWDSISTLIPAGFELAPDFALPETFYGGPLMDSYLANAQADLRWKILDNNQLNAGAVFETGAITRVGNHMTHDPLTLEYRGLQLLDGDIAFNELRDRRVIGAYVQDQHTIGDFKITAGARFDSYSDFGNAFSPRIAVVYSTPIDSRVKVLYGHAFRAPSFLELYDRYNPVTYGDENLDAERVRTIEVAYLQRFGRYFEGGITGFHNTLDNIIQPGEPVEAEDNPLLAPIFINGGEQVLRGVELEGRLNPMRGLSVIANYTHLFEKGLPVSADAAALAANYSVDRFNFNVNGYFRSKVDALPLQDPYVILNANIRVGITQKVWAHLTVKNLLDQQVRTISALLPEGVPNRGRTVLVGVRAEL